MNSATSQSNSSIPHSYARNFIRSRISIFRKDINICLKADSRGRHAYMPGLLACISLLELFSGLYKGSLYPIGLNGIIEYSKKFLDTNIYTEDRLSVLYLAFRHKIAHITQPYGVFKTRDNRRITWKVAAGRRPLPIEIVDDVGTLYKEPPWPVTHSHRCIVSIYRLKVDIPKSALKTGGYLDFLKTDLDAQDNFKKCMLEYYKK